MHYVGFEEDILRGETNHRLLISMSKHTVFLHLCYRVPTKKPPFFHQTVFWALLSQSWPWPSGFSCCCVLPLFFLTCSFPRCVYNRGCGLWFLLQQRDSPENHEPITSAYNTMVSSPLQSLFVIYLVFVFDCVPLFGSRLHLFTWSPSSWPPDRSSLPFFAPSFSICLFEKNTFGLISVYGLWMLGQTKNLSPHTYSPWGRLVYMEIYQITASEFLLLPY